MILIAAWEEISVVGNRLVSQGLTASRFGNISLLTPGGIIITRTGSMLEDIGPDDVVLVTRDAPCPSDSLASCETPAHRAVYRRTQAGAVVHTHSTFAITMSLLLSSPLEPIDSEGRAFLGPIPTVEGEFGTVDLGERVGEALTDVKACIVRGHGPFCRGRDLVEAYTVACMVEHSCRVMYLVDLWKRS